MDGTRFDALARTLTVVGSRRRALAAIGGALGVLGWQAVGDANAKKGKRKKRHKKPPLVFNTFGCLNVGQACRGTSVNCCSGICQGKKPKKGKKDASRCVAHNTGGCTVDSCFAGTIIPCGTGGTCTRTTGQANFCALPGPLAGVCTVCRRDTDCQAAFGLGAACIICASACPATTTACFAPAV